MFDVSQLPVLDDGRWLASSMRATCCLPCIATATIRVAGATGDDDARCETVDRRASIDDLLPIFDAGLVAVVSDETAFTA